MQKHAIITVCQHNSEDKFVLLFMIVVLNKLIGEAKYQEQGYWRSWVPKKI